MRTAPPSRINGTRVKPIGCRWRKARNGTPTQTRAQSRSRSWWWNLRSRTRVIRAARIHNDGVGEEVGIGDQDALAGLFEDGVAEIDVDDLSLEAGDGDVVADAEAAEQQ